MNPLRHDSVYTVKQEQLDALKKINKEWGVAQKPLHPIYPRIEQEEVNFLRSRVVAGDKPRMKYIPLKQDVEGNLRSIRNAAKNASLVIASNHCHEREQNLSNKWGLIPPEFIQKYARDCIDAGADIYHGHGDHAGEGIEIYKGRPIFYSLANPIVTSPSIKRLPLEEYERSGMSNDMSVSDFGGPSGPGGRANYATDQWTKSVVAQCTMRDHRLTELKLYPIDSTAGEPVGSFVNRGVRPLMVRGEEARKIIERYAGLSEPFGTEIEFKDGVGVVKV